MKATDKSLFAGVAGILGVQSEDSTSHDYEAYSLSSATTSSSKSTAKQFKRKHKSSFAPQRFKLDQFLASAICGNDILGSCLYAAGLVSASAGRWAPVCFILVNILMTLFRPIYTEVGQALPVNGGTYTLLLNTSSKFAAAFAGTLTLIAYAATAVVSANSAMHYLNEMFPSIEIYWSVVLVLFVFSILGLIGIRESAFNALIIFTIHIVTLIVYFVACTIYLIREDKFETLRSNFGILPSDIINALLSDPSTVPAVSSTTAAAVSAASGASSTWTFSFGHDLHAIFIGYSVGLLGVTGFETSCNYIEEQAKGVYPKVIRNVWILVSIVNPLVSFLSLAILPAEAVPGAKTHLLSSTALLAQGTWLQTMIALDAVTVLSGAVLTAFIGVQGLVYRMSVDGCLPSLFTQRSAARDTQHQTILTFFLICVSLHIISAADIRVLSATYTCSFLMLLGCFVCGNIKLKLDRQALLLHSGSSGGESKSELAMAPTIEEMTAHQIAANKGGSLDKSSKAGWFTLIFALIGVAIGLLGTFTYQPQMMIYSLGYILAVFIIVQACIYRVSLLRIMAWALSFVPALRPYEHSLKQYIVTEVKKGIVYFVQASEGKPELREALAYILKNEERKLIKFVAVTPEKMNPSLEISLRTLIDSLAIEYHAHENLHLQFEPVTGVMSKSLIRSLHRRWNIPPNFMFTSCPEPRTTLSKVDSEGNIAPWSYKSIKGTRIVAEGPQIQKIKRGTPFSAKTHEEATNVISANSPMNLKRNLSFTEDSDLVFKDHVISRPLLDIVAGNLSGVDDSLSINHHHDIPRHLPEKSELVGSLGLHVRSTDAEALLSGSPNQGLGLVSSSDSVNSLMEKNVWGL